MELLRLTSYYEYIAVFLINIIKLFYQSTAVFYGIVLVYCIVQSLPATRFILYSQPLVAKYQVLKVIPGAF